jgi:hypothetical protein
LYLVLVSSSNLDKARKVAQLALGGALRSTRQTQIGDIVALDLLLLLLDCVVSNDVAGGDIVALDLLLLLLDCVVSNDVACRSR